MTRFCSPSRVMGGAVGVVVGGALLGGERVRRRNLCRGVGERDYADDAEDPNANTVATTFHEEGGGAGLRHALLWRLELATLV